MRLIMAPAADCEIVETVPSWSVVCEWSRQGGFRFELCGQYIVNVFLMEWRG
jgi:hypothetical protein